MRKLLLLTALNCFIQQAWAGNCEKLLCIATGAGRTSVAECKNNSLSELYQDIWSTYDENHCDETNAILNKGNWSCDLSDGPGTVQSVTVSTICIRIYNVKVRVANVVTVDGMPGAIVIGGKGTPMGGGGGSAGFTPFTVEDDDDDMHTVSGKVVCTGKQCSPVYSVD